MRPIQVLATAASLALGVAGAATPSGNTCGGDPTGVIPQAAVKGFRDDHCNNVFLGIPFAATTGGTNR